MQFLITEGLFWGRSKIILNFVLTRVAAQCCCPLFCRWDMPKGTKVHKLYEELIKQGFTKEKAIRIAQSKTGQSFKTGKKL